MRTTVSFKRDSSTSLAIQRLRQRWGAYTAEEVVRRAITTVDVLSEFQQGGGQLVLCKEDMPEKVVWFV